jgi:hypothetical protein
MTPQQLKRWKGYIPLVSVLESQTISPELRYSLQVLTQDGSMVLLLLLVSYFHFSEFAGRTWDVLAHIKEQTLMKYVHHSTRFLITDVLTWKLLDGAFTSQ